MEGDGAEADADALRDALGAGVLSRAATLERLRGPGPLPLDDERITARLDEAETAFQMSDQERAVGLIEGVARDLAADLVVSDARRVQLEQTRLLAATRWMALAGPGETGRGETLNGQRARALLVDALRADPTLTLAPDRFPPKMRQLLVGARAALVAAGEGVVDVDSTPAGATVLVEGRVVGTTPCRVALPAGRHRLHLVDHARASRVRTLDVVGGATSRVSIDVALEGNVWADGVGVHALPDLHDDARDALFGMLGADAIVLVGRLRDDAGGALWALRVTSSGEVVQRGGVRGPGPRARLALFLGHDGRDGVDPALAPLPAGAHLAAAALVDARAAKASTSTTSSTSAPSGGSPRAGEDDGALWWWVGGGAAVVVVGAGIGAAFAVAHPTVVPHLALDVVEAP